MDNESNINQVTRDEYSKIRNYLRGEQRTIQIGMSKNSAGMGTHTPVIVEEGTNPPKLLGNPYLKTNFSNGKGFSRTLYTPSTLYVTVGREWLNSHE